MNLKSNIISLLHLLYNHYEDGFLNHYKNKIQDKIASVFKT